VCYGTVVLLCTLLEGMRCLLHKVHGRLKELLLNSSFPLISPYFLCAVKMCRLSRMAICVHVRVFVVFVIVVCSPSTEGLFVIQNTLAYLEEFVGFNV
jgi:hypothetical protein